MLSDVLKNKKIIIAVVALILVVGVSIILFNGFIGDDGSKTGTETEVDSILSEDEPYDGDGLDVVEPQDNTQENSKEDSTSVDGSWEEETESKNSNESSEKDNKNDVDKKDDTVIEDNNNDTGNEKNEGASGEEEVAEDEKTWGTIF